MTRLFVLILASVCFLGVSCAHKKQPECHASGKGMGATDSCCAAPAKKHTH